MVEVGAFFGCQSDVGFSAIRVVAPAALKRTTAQSLVKCEILLALGRRLAMFIR